MLLELGHDTFVDSSGLQVLSSSGTGSPNEIPAAFLIDGMSDCDERLLDFFGSLEHLVRQAESPD